MAFGYIHYFKIKWITGNKTKFLRHLKIVFSKADFFSQARGEKKNKNRSFSITIVLINILDLYKEWSPHPDLYSVHIEQ